MNKIFLFIAIVVVSASPGRSADPVFNGKNIDMEKLEGITHYGMPIDEIKKTYRKDDSVLEIVYSKIQSDDNMDDYVQRFYDELLRKTENWLYSNSLPARNVRIVISNCKFCKVGYCKRKNVKEVSLVSYMNEKKMKQVSFSHNDIIETKKHDELAQSAITILLDKYK
jgi:hypothetical protein